MNNRALFLMLALCAISVNANAALGHTSYLPTAPSDTLVSMAGFPLAMIWEIVSSPGFINLALLAVAFFAKQNAGADRWSRVLTIGFSILRELKDAGTTDWSKLVSVGLAALVREINARPDIKSLSEKEVELLKAPMVEYAKRITGKVERPMVD